MTWDYQTFSTSVGNVICPSIGSLPVDGGLPTAGPGAWRVKMNIDRAVVRLFNQHAPKGWAPVGASDGASLWRTGHVDASVVGPDPTGDLSLALHAVRLDCRRLAP